MSGVLKKDDLPPGYHDVIDICTYLTKECYKLIYFTVDEHEILLSNTNHKEVIINVVTNMIWKLYQAVGPKEEKIRVLDLISDALEHMKEQQP